MANEFQDLVTKLEIGRINGVIPFKFNRLKTQVELGFQYQGEGGDGGRVSNMSVLRQEELPIRKDQLFCSTQTFSQLEAHLHYRGNLFYPFHRFKY